MFRTNDAQIKSAFDAVLNNIVQQLSELPFEARELFIESFSTVLLRGFVPMSGMTVQQHAEADAALLAKLNELMQKNDAYKNSTDARYVYQFAREATSAGVLPVYRDKKTGELYIGLICNKRNMEMYNWSAGYTEAPLAGWRGKLHAERTQEISYNRAKIKESATNTMRKILAEAEGDWNKVDFSYKKFKAGFEADGVSLPKVDFNSMHTASRECVEEMGLDLEQYPERKTFLISYDNTLGISQGDAPGQTSNRSHQYMVYLGEFDVAPPLTPGDDVGIAEWVKVRDIERKSPTEYIVNQKPLCIYMLRALETGLKDLWQHLLQQASTLPSRYSSAPIARFSSIDNVIAEIERFALANQINLECTPTALFLQKLANMPEKTYTGKTAQDILGALLRVIPYLMRPNFNKETFEKDITGLLAQGIQFYKHPHMLSFKPAHAKIINLDNKKIFGF